MSTTTTLLLLFNYIQSHFMVLPLLVRRFKGHPSLQFKDFTYAELPNLLPPKICISQSIPYTHPQTHTNTKHTNTTNQITPLII